MGFCALRGVEGRGGGNTDRREVLRGRGGFHSVRRRPADTLLRPLHARDRAQSRRGACRRIFRIGGHVCGHSRGGRTRRRGNLARGRRSGVHRLHVGNDRRPQGGDADFREHVREHESRGGGEILFRRNTRADNAAVPPHTPAHGHARHAALRRRADGVPEVDFAGGHFGDSAKTPRGHGYKRAALLRASAHEHNGKDKPLGAFEGRLCPRPRARQPQIFARAVFVHTQEVRRGNQILDFGRRRARPQCVGGSRRARFRPARRIRNDGVRPDNSLSENRQD